MPAFELVSDFVPMGDQPQAIAKLTEGLLRGDRYQTLLGVTGSGKTYVMAKVIETVQRPTLVIAHNKTLAAQLYSEFKEFFPAQRGGVLCLLLRLLPARSLHPAHRHLHREGRADQRGDRPAAPGGHLGSLLAARRDHRGLGLLHLRPGRPRGVRPGGHQPAAGRDSAAATRMLRHLVDIYYERNDCGCSAAASSACAATRWRSCPPTGRRPTASSSGATRSSASWRSTR